MTEKYQICNRCVMDTTDPGIQFDHNGICNHCRDAIERLGQFPYNLDKKSKEQELHKLLAKVKENGKGKTYDCVIGISGGVDSTYTIYKAKKLGLRPLALHLDNGWNSEFAVHNIEKICKKLDIHLFTHVMDWEEFRDIQLSFLKASTPDSEIPTDHGIQAILYRVAVKHKLKYIITGDNYISESILPFAWSHGHYDWKYIRSLHKKFGTQRFKTFPHVSYFKLFLYHFIKPIKNICLLDFLDYDKSEAMTVLKDELGWEPYTGKHHESIYTKFFQAYILPEKFNFDKRKAHLSSLICAGQLSRDEALKELEKPLYTQQELVEDREYAATKLGLTVEQFQKIMELPPKEFWDYPSYENSWYYKLARKFYRLLTGKKSKMKRILSMVHRVLLHFWPYKKLVYTFGLDSYKYKKYYRDLHYNSSNIVSASDVDGYTGEGEFDKIVSLVGNLAQVIPAPGSVLDIGCGTGRYLKQMSQVWPQAHLEGIDISPEIVEKFTRKQVPGVPIHVLDIETDEAFHIDNREKFDLVCMIGIIQILSLKRIHVILDRINALCKAAGHLYIQFNVETLEKKTTVGYKRYSIDELTELLGQHGFKVVKSRRTDILKDYAYIVAEKIRNPKPEIAQSTNKSKIQIF